jgi:prepilin-type N-terminal cleavage/methylation domain-containing protein
MLKLSCSKWSDNVKKGFTLVELLAVIVILAIILAIAIPSISNMIDSSKISAFESNAEMLLASLNYKVLENNAFDPTSVNEANVKSVLNVDDSNYKSLTVKKINSTLYVTIVGKNKWNNLVASGTRTKMHIDNNILLWLDGRDFSNNPTTTLWLDKSLNTNNGTPTGFGYTISSGSDGNFGVAFDGVDDYVSTPLILPATGTIEAVFTPKSFYDYNTLWENNINVDAYECWIYSSGLLSARGGLGSSSVSKQLELNKTYQVVYTWNDETKSQQLYIDGALASSNTTLVTTARSTLTIGGRFNTKSNGVFKSFKVYNKVLTPKEVLNNYNDYVK